MTGETDKVADAQAASGDLNVSEIRYRRLFESARDGILILDAASRRITDVNPYMVELMGYSRDEFLGKELWEIGLFRDKDESRIAFRELQATGYIRYEDLPLQTKAGKQWNVEFISNVYQEDGHQVIQCNIRDITERRRAEEAKFLMAAIVESSEDSIISIDFERTITTWNKGAERLYGYTAGEALGKPLTMLTLPRDMEEVLSNIDKIRRGETVEPFETVRRQKDGPHLHLAVVLSPVKDAAGRIIGVSTVARDISERKRAEAERERLLADAQAAKAEAERANRLKDEFLATLSHELRTPLTAIVGWSEMLGKSQLDPVTSQRAVEVIRRNARMQVQMIDDLLDVSRIVTGKLRMTVQPVDLGSVIIAAVEGLRPAAEAKEIRFQLQLDSPAGQVSGDPDRLQQVAWNLVSNAIKFTPRGGRVLVRLERVRSQVEVAVSDTGRGIAPEFLSHVFERFRQADATTTRVYGGLGLGLSIVRQLVELHGGTVRVESAGEGQGSTFTVSLPLAAVRGAAEDAGAVRPQSFTPSDFACPPQLGGLRVLVADDEEDTCEVLQAIIESCGARVRTVNSAAAALRAMEEESFDVLISDIGMPEEDGYSLIAKVRALDTERGGGIPAAALTAYAGEEDRIRTLRSGFQIHVPKPVSPNELVAVVANLADRSGRG
ncbi:MAG TPA: PAS domain S-box protein [Pyrinomonadaceae bacterium]|nr:PAS domain S-box protein [Pyrinomonadaceae bacterium]